jgi:hypothetical protein
MFVEVVGSADEGEVGKGLGKVAEVFTTWSEFLGIEPEVIGIAEGLVEQESGLLEIAGTGDALDVPERAHGEGAFVAAESVVSGFLSVIAEDEGILDEDLFDAAKGEEPAAIVGRDEPEEGHEETGGIYGVAAFVLDEALEFGVPEVSVDIVMNGSANLVPAIERRGQGAFHGQADPAIECDPAHEPGEEEFLALPADFPDALVWQLPMLTDPIDDLGDAGPGIITDGAPVFVVEIDGIEEFAVDIELELAPCGIADADWFGTAVAFEMIEADFVEVMVSIEAVHDLERAGGPGLPANPVEPAEEGAGFVGETESHQGVEGKGAVADPSIAIVPIAFPADLFGKPEGGSGDHGPMLG